MIKLPEEGEYFLARFFSYKKTFSKNILSKKSDMSQQPFKCLKILEKKLKLKKLCVKN